MGVPRCQKMLWFPCVFTSKWHRQGPQKCSQNRHRFRTCEKRRREHEKSYFLPEWTTENVVSYCAGQQIMKITFLVWRSVSAPILSGKVAILGSFWAIISLIFGDDFWSSKREGPKTRNLSFLVLRVSKTNSETGGLGPRGGIREGRPPPNIIYT